MLMHTGGGVPHFRKSVSASCNSRQAGSNQRRQRAGTLRSSVSAPQGERLELVAIALRRACLLRATEESVYPTELHGFNHSIYVGRCEQISAL